MLGSGYIRILRRPGTARLLAPALVARIPDSIAATAIVILVRSVTGSYAAAGLAAGAFGIGTAVSAPLAGRMVDRLGQRRVLPVLAAAFAGALIMLLFSSELLGGGAAVVLAAVAGLTRPPIEAALRTLWPRLVSPAQVEAAYALDSTVQELIWITGPLLLALLLAAGSRQLPLIACAALSIAGTAVYTLGLRAAPGARNTRTAAASPLRQPRLRVLLVCGLCYGISAGMLNLALVAFAGAHGGVAWAGVLVAIWGAGSLVGGLAYGSRSWKGPVEGRAMICLALFGALLMLLAAAPGLIVLALFMACLGIPLSPWLGSLSASVQRAVPAANSTEAFAWAFAVITVGMAAGNAISGVVIQSANTQAAFAAAGGLSLAGALLGASWLGVRQHGALSGHYRTASPRRGCPGYQARLANGANPTDLGASAPPVRLLQVPYDAGAFDARMGSGPLALAAAGAQRLRGRGHAVEEVLLGPAPSSWRAELRTAFELHHVIADAVTTARTRKQLPLLLAGNCNATLGVLAGLAHPGLRLGLVWLDAHGDFNTPELDQTGSLDGQGLAMIVGRCWRSLTSAVPGFSPLPERRVLLIGARSLDTAEKAALRRSELAWLTSAQARRPDAVTTALKVLADEADIVHFHVDLDVYDPSIAPANSYATADGLLAGDVRRIITQTASHLPIASAALASYDPAFDPHARMRQTAVDLLEQLASSGTPIPPSKTGVPAHHRRQGHARTCLSRRSVIRPQSARAAPRPLPRGAHPASHQPSSPPW